MGEIGIEVLSGDLRLRKVRKEHGETTQVRLALVGSRAFGPKFAVPLARDPATPGGFKLSDHLRARPGSRLDQRRGPDREVHHRG